jgi:hypothetical protein
MFLQYFQTALTVWYFSICFSKWFLNCSDSGVFVYMISELLWHCCIFCMFFYMISELFWQCGIFLHDFGTALTVWYFSTCFSTWFRNCSDSVVYPTWFLNCSDSVVFPTWFLKCSVSVVFPTWFLNYSDSVLFFYMISELLWQFCIFLHVFLNDFWTVLSV